MENMDRRTFLKGGAGLAAGAALLGAAGCAPSTPAANDALASTAAGELPADLKESDFEFSIVEREPITEFAAEETYDIVVVGAGCAGVPAVLTAVEEGAKVACLQKEATVSANGNGCSFVVKAHSNPAGIVRWRSDWARLNDWRINNELFNYYVEYAEEAVPWVISQGRSVGIEPIEFLTDSSIRYDDGGVVAVCDATQASNQDLMVALAQKAAEGGATFYYETPCVQLVQEEDGTVTGAIGKQKDGSYVKLNATKGVVLAAGDYAADPEMLDYYTAWDFDSFDPDFFINESTGTGDGHKIGLWAGAAMQPGPHPLMTFMAYAYSYLRVNNLGQRYVNEDTGYTGGGNAQLIQPAGASWAIWDDKWREELPAQMPYAGGMSWDQDGRRIQDPWTPEGEEELAFSWEIESGLLVQADSLEELAGAMGLAPEATDTFLATVKRYNELVDAGDTDFGKRPELMAKIEQPPFYGLRMNVELGVSVSGLITNADSECLTEAGAVIPGLYAVGNNAGGLFGIDYNEVTIPGISLGRCVTFGWLLGQHLAK